ncbi:MAG TPA: peptidylprolyl isomerase [Thermoanaerobaculia bacterium]|nr:peptidylprolyl isomerase [Thermoanaerobaculia bacterium]
MRLRRRTPIALALLAATLLADCRERPVRSHDAVATIGDRELSYPEFQSYLDANSGGAGEQLAAEVLSGLLDQFLEERLLARLAEEMGLAAPGTGTRSALSKLLADGENAIDRAAIDAYYGEHAAEFSQPERVRLRQILTDTSAEADRARRRILGGEDFAKVAREVSKAPDAGSGGGPSELARTDLPPELAAAILSLDPGELSAVIAADYGFHLFQVVEKLPAERLPLEAVRGQIRRRLAEDARRARLERLLLDARSRYNLELYAENLPFEYRGRYGRTGG